MTEPVCANCIHWEPKDSKDTPLYTWGYCAIGDRLTAYDAFACCAVDWLHDVYEVEHEPEVVACQK